MSIRSVTLRSLAKINLDLRVLYKRPDGYHELRTIFQTVSLADAIGISFTPEPTTTITLDSAVDIPDNLIGRAAKLVLAANQATGRLAFRLTKRIPMGGGLGGGSSNAAATLLALPVLTGRPLSMETLQELAAQLGSDVPFFLYGGAALGLGRGTELYPAPEPGPLPAVLITPGLHVSTPEAYRGLARAPMGQEPDGLTSRSTAAILNEFQSLAWRIGEAGVWDSANDFEPVVFSQHPQLESIKGSLVRLGARPALMSGSGSTLFGIFDSRAARDAAAVSMRNELSKDRIHPVSLVNRSRYRSLWRAQLADYCDPNPSVWPPRPLALE